LKVLGFRPTPKEKRLYSLRENKNWCIEELHASMKVFGQRENQWMNKYRSMKLKGIET